MHRRRRGRRGRLPIQPTVGVEPDTKRLVPDPVSVDEPLYLNLAELEAMRLVDFEGLYQEDAGERMGVSRATVWRLLSSGRKKVVSAIIHGRPLHLDTPPEE